MIDLKKLLSRKIYTIDKQIEEMKHVRDNAATPTESGSDKTRQNAEYLVDSLNDARQQLILLEKELNNMPAFNNFASANSLVTLRSTDDPKTYLLVPDGLGGENIDEVFLLSIDTPLAKTFIYQKVGFHFSFNNISFDIISISENK